MFGQQRIYEKHTEMFDLKCSSMIDFGKSYPTPKRVSSKKAWKKRGKK